MSDLPANLADAPAHLLGSLFASGDASPVEACRAVLGRIERFNPEFKAFVRVDAEGALGAARASEARWHGKSALGPLDGVPVSIKDLILAKGLPTLRGSFTVDEDRPWDVDSPVAARLREAGAVLLGKTATPEFGCKGETNSPRSGFTRNPWNPACTPGGSSGGAAAAVALGMGPIAVGTDGAGSVRIPAAFCGNFGLKPSFGRVPAYPLSPMGTVAHLGPHTMNVRDAALAMNVMKRPDARDWTSLPPNDDDYTATLGQGLNGLRIAWSPRLGYAQVHPEVAASVRAAVRSLEDAGAQVTEVDPGFEDPLEIMTGLWFAGTWMIWNTLTPEQQAGTDPDFRAQTELGRQISALHLQQLHVRRGALGSHMRQFMEHYDLLVTPSVAVPAFGIRAPGTVPMTAEAMLGWTPFSYPFNLTQQPACTVPCGLTVDGLPIGIQFVGPMFRDDLVLRAAAAYEAIRPIPRPPVVRACAG
jgi:aspartyl-tRNA(Asn)/glutamyl-tRNA(Gln) amidotransferase subunit A